MVAAENSRVRLNSAVIMAAPLVMAGAPDPAVMAGPPTGSLLGMAACAALQASGIWLTGFWVAAFLFLARSYLGNTS